MNTCPHIAVYALPMSSNVRCLMLLGLVTAVKVLGCTVEVALMSKGGAHQQQAAP